MLGPEADTAGGERAQEGLRLAEECRAIHQRLLSIARALEVLREEIDRALVEDRKPRELGDPAEDQEARSAG